MGNIKCDQCRRTILYPEKYLFIEESKGKNQTLCMNCCRDKGLVKSSSEKGDAEVLFDLSNE